MTTLRTWCRRMSTSSCDETVSITKERAFSRRFSGRVSHLASVIVVVARDGLLVCSSLSISSGWRPWNWVSSMSSSISVLPVSTPFNIMWCHFLSGVAVHSMSFWPVMAAVMVLLNGIRSIAVKSGWEIAMQLPLSFHLTAMMVASVCGASVILVASTAFIPVRRSLGSTVGGICSMRHAGWCHCQGLLSNGGCASLGVFGVGQMVGPVAKTFLGLAGF